MERHSVVSHDDWLAARRVLLHEEKEFTRQRDRLNERRRELPWEAVNVAYHYLDLVPKGRDEDEQKLFWVRRHDEY